MDTAAGTDAKIQFTGSDDELRNFSSEHETDDGLRVYWAFIYNSLLRKENPTNVVV
jgi:hypothetical protein